MTSLRSLPLGRRLSIPGALVVSTLALAAGPSPATAAARPTAGCDVTGLDFSYASAGATHAVKVLSLHAAGLTCPSASGLVELVAMDLLHGRRLPARINGLAVAVHKPCAGCAPRYTGSGTLGRRRVTFVIAGGG